MPTPDGLYVLVVGAANCMGGCDSSIYGLIVARLWN